MASPVGELVLTAAGDRLTGCWFATGTGRADPSAGLARDDDALAEVRRQLEEYFAGDRREFDLDLAPEGTPFQQQVWAQLRAIPYGETASYGEVAAALGAPGASRAVGSANGANPIAIVVPCHRVVGADGRLTGYAGGTDRKRTLLDLERGILPLA
ncbi:MAG: methylated-DNA--[protein]-cysteine S-methyltransferase [Acidimicrobiales bacterium]|nr:methylated-DNA--[protein]-cysteine S-methyltransferase [Acidimicrobiales bacterium]